MDKKPPLRPAGAQDQPEYERPKKEPPAHPDPELDAIWRIAAGLDLGSRSVLEAEVLMWRICKAKSIPLDATRRALNEDWENE